MTVSHLLAHVLAATDALFLPLRKLPGLAGVMDRRRLYRQSGLRFVLPGSDPADKKAAERALADAVDSGLVACTRRAAYRSLARLTDRGEAVARHLCATWLPADSWPVAEAIRDLLPEAWTLVSTGESWIAEVQLLPEPREPGNYAGLVSKDLAAIEELLLPALAAGWIRSAADRDGRVWYAPTARMPSACPPPHQDMPDFDSRLGDLYDRLRAEVLAERDSWEGPPGAVEVPLPVGGWRSPAKKRKARR